MSGGESRRASGSGGWRFVLAALSVCVFFVCVSCNRDEERAASMTGGDPKKGRAAIARYGCAGCHTIPGIKGANASVGPTLAQIASRATLGGGVENRPENMLRWLQDPLSVKEKTTMPNLGVTDSDARDIASYLYTLR